MSEDSPITVDPEIRSAVTEALKSIPGFKALVAEATRRLADINQDDWKGHEEEDKEKNGDNSTGERLFNPYC